MIRKLIEYVGLSLLLGAVLLALLGALDPLLAAGATLPEPGLNNDAWPPARYTENVKRARITFVDHQSREMARACGEPDPGTYHFGCSNRAGRWIVIETPCHAPASDDYARQLCHELAHLNGWPATHPRD